VSPRGSAQILGLLLGATRATELKVNPPGVTHLDRPQPTYSCFSLSIRLDGLKSKVPQMAVQSSRSRADTSVLSL
jgi:hypothetical protein